MSDLTKAMHAVLRPWDWGELGGLIKQGLNYIAQGFGHILEAGAFAVVAAEYAVAWLDLQQVGGMLNRAA